MSVIQSRIPILMVFPNHSLLDLMSFQRHLDCLTKQVKNQNVTCVNFGISEPLYKQDLDLAHSFFEDIGTVIPERNLDLMDLYWHGVTDALDSSAQKLTCFNVLDAINILKELRTKAYVAESSSKFLQKNFYNAKAFLTKLFGSYQWLGEQIILSQPDLVVADFYTAVFLLAFHRDSFILKYELPSIGREADVLKEKAWDYISELNLIVELEQYNPELVKPFVAGSFRSRRYGKVDFEMFSFPYPKFGRTSGLISDSCFGLASFCGKNLIDTFEFKKKYLSNFVYASDIDIKHEIHYQLKPKHKSGVYFWPGSSQTKYDCQMRLLTKITH